MLSAADPNLTTKSIVSVNSVNLEKINQRNTDRLAKLEAIENANDFGSSFIQNTSNSNIGYVAPNRDPTDSTVRNAVATPVSNPVNGQVKSDLQQLDEMLADILK